MCDKWIMDIIGYLKKEEKNFPKIDEIIRNTITNFSKNVNIRKELMSKYFSCMYYLLLVILATTKINLSDRDKLYKLCYPNDEPRKIIIIDGSNLSKDPSYISFLTNNIPSARFYILMNSKEKFEVTAEKEQKLLSFLYNQLLLNLENDENYTIIFVEKGGLETSIDISKLGKNIFIGLKLKCVNALNPELGSDINTLCEKNDMTDLIISFLFYQLKISLIENKKDPLEILGIVTNNNYTWYKDTSINSSFYRLVVYRGTDETTKFHKIEFGFLQLKKKYSYNLVEIIDLESQQEDEPLYDAPEFCELNRDDSKMDIS
jgi:hypothetical protein